MKPIHVLLLTPILLPFMAVMGAVIGILGAIAFTLVLAHEAGRLFMRGW